MWLISYIYWSFWVPPPPPHIYMQRENSKQKSMHAMQYWIPYLVFQFQRIIHCHVMWVTNIFILNLQLLLLLLFLLLFLYCYSYRKVTYLYFIPMITPRNYIAWFVSLCLSLILINIYIPLICFNISRIINDLINNVHISIWK